MKFTIWNASCARATAFIFDKQKGILVNVSNFLRQKMSRPDGDLNPPTFGFMPNAITIGLSGPDICCPMFCNTGSGGIDNFEVLDILLLQ